jgi:hypothetical protein
VADRDRVCHPCGRFSHVRLLISGLTHMHLWFTHARKTFAGAGELAEGAAGFAGGTANNPLSRNLAEGRDGTCGACSPPGDYLCMKPPGVCAQTRITYQSRPKEPQTDQTRHFRVRCVRFAPSDLLRFTAWSARLRLIGSQRDTCHQSRAGPTAPSIDLTSMVVAESIDQAPRRKGVQCVDRLGRSAPSADPCRPPGCLAEWKGSRCPHAPRRPQRGSGASTERGR